MINPIIKIKVTISKLNKNWGAIIKTLEPLSKKDRLTPNYNYELGFAYCKTREWKKAYENLDNAISSVPTNLSWLYRCAIAAENSGKPNRYKEIISDIQTRNGMNDKKHYKSGVLLLGFSRPRDAEECFRKAISINGNKFKYHIGLAIALHNQGKSKSWQEIIALEKAIHLNPYSAEAHFNLGMNYETMQNYYMASVCYIKAILFKFSNKNYLEEYISNIRKQSDNKQNDITIKKQLALFSESESYFNNGTLHIFTDPHEAETNLRKAIELNNKIPYYYTALAESLNQQGESKLWQEHDALTSAISLGSSDAKAFFRLGIIKEKMQNYVNACNAYSGALENGLSNLEVHYRLGYCLEMLGRVDDASKSYEIAISYDEKLNSKRFGIGVIHNKYGHRELAINSLQQKSKNSIDGELFYKLGMVYDRCYDWKSANKSYKRAIKLVPNNFDWQFRLGFTFERLKNYKEASYWYEKAALGRARHTPYWFYRLGYALFLYGDYKKSCEAFIKISNDFTPVIVNATFKNVADSLLAEAVALENNEQYDEAIALLREAIERRTGKAGKFLYRIGCILYKQGLYRLASQELLKMRVLRDAHGVSDKAYREREDISLLCDYNKYYYESNVQENSILYESFHGSSISCNPLAIYLSIQKDNRFDKFKHYFVINNELDVPDNLKNKSNVYFIKRESDIYLEKLATAKILINNSTFPPYFIKKEDQVYVNTWHGTPLKTLGRDMKSRFLEHKNFTRNILQSDLLISPNKFTTDVLERSHGILDIYSGEIFESGYPRIDLTLSNSRDSILAKLNISSENKIIFYAPTWRGTHGDIDFDTTKLVNDLEQLSLIKNATVVFRGHSLIESLLNGITIKNVHILDKTIDTNEFLSCADLLITDYSSILFDFIPTKRPIIYYAYDLAEYINERGLYIDINKLPGNISYNLDELVTAVNEAIQGNQNIEDYESAIPIYNAHDDGNASTRVVQKIHDLTTKNKDVTFSNQKKSYLFYAGPFMRNGITTSFINLANNLVRHGCTVSVVVDPGSIGKHQERLDLISRLDQEVNIIGRVGGMNFNIEERYLHGERNRDFTLPNEEMLALWQRSWKMEFKRIFGNARFDYIVNFEGYSTFWSALFSSVNNKPNTIYQHNDMYGEMSQKYPYLKATFNTYNYFNRIISVSKETMDLNISTLSDRFLIEKCKFAYSENLLNLDTIFSLSKQEVEEEDRDIFNGDGKIFISIGRLSIEKDHAKLLRAFRMVVDNDSSSKLILLGEGPLKADLISLRHELNLQDSVFILGHRNNPYPYLYKSDCFVLSSNHEGQPMTLLEALTLNKDIIATSIPGNNSVLSLIQETGVENTVNGLADALLCYCRNAKKQRKFNYKEYQERAINKFFSVTGLKI
ncbi:CDP-glycerol glycerophosphotransferase family protein [Aeromonas veronii]|uniref:CDP-glycerol glycerophosphotransferase family protein n=1 Tax=Aeromonas veronii TaxID=654 RepID=UPI001F2D3975|nr:CDP-glycerol glycerophosphotransferase family protein [Aeromonas veronii]MCF5716838.1 CDP-glycerol glycerophosphotransferase family protein [Aeromonas veronii]